MKRQKVTMRRKMVSLLLAMAIVFTVQEMPVSAETVRERAGATASPANPVHNCTKQNDGTDTTTWSYVYFGSYPQSEVTGAALTSKIVGAAYDVNGDAWVDGTKYRRISKSTNPSIDFGDSTYRYFKWERIKWRVLQNNGSTLFLMADKGLDCSAYNRVKEAIWEKSSLRIWLNNDFYDTAFCGSEQDNITLQTVVNEDNPYYNTDGGNDTVDKLFLLSLSEVRNPDYGFCEDKNVHSVSRNVKASDYAYVRGTYISGDGNECWWWLRSPGDCRFEAQAMEGNISGYIDSSGRSVTINSRACVPAMHINLSSNLWSMTDDGTSGAGGEDQELDPEEILTEIKNQGKEELETYKNPSDYREEQKKELAEAVAAGKAAIEAAADEDEVTCALTAAKEAIDRIKTDEQLTEEEQAEASSALAAAKTESKNALESYKNASDYRKAQQAELAEAIAAGKAAIEAAADKAEVNHALAEAKAAIDRIKTDVQLTEEEREEATAALTASKAKSKNELENYKNASDYRKVQQAELAEAIAAGKAAIEAAADEAGITSALAAAKEAIDQIKTDAQLTEKECEDLAAVLADQLKEYKTLYDGGGSDYTAATWNRFEDAYEAVQKALQADKKEKEILENLLEELNAAKAGLIIQKPDPEPVVDPETEALRAGLREKLNEYRPVFSGTGEIYTGSSWAAFSTAYTNAQNALAWEVEDIAALSSLKNQLEDTYRKLVLKPAGKQILTAPEIASVVFSAQKKKLGVKITVQKVANAASYTVYRAVGGIVTKIGVTDTSGIIYDENPVGRKLMSYYAVANPSSASYQESGRGMAKGITLGTSVKKIKAKRVKKKKQVNISWKKVKGAKQYIIYRSVKKDSGYVKVKSLKAKKRSYTDKKVKKGKKYYYRIVVKTRKGYSGITTSKAVKI